jgi:hypothetical protein
LRALRQRFPIVFTLLLALVSLAFHTTRAALGAQRPAPRCNVSGAVLAGYRYIAATGHNIGPRSARSIQSPAIPSPARSTRSGGRRVAWNFSADRSPKS